MPRAIRIRRAAWAAIALLAIAGSARAASLDYRGSVLSARQAESALQQALDAPGDSVALTLGLERVVGRLQELGYLDARVRAEWRGTPASRLALAIDEGERYRLTAITIAAPSARDSSAIHSALDVRIGDLASPRAVREALGRALDDVTNHGFPYAELGVIGWDADSGRVALRLSGTLGPEVRIAQVRIEGLAVTRRAVAAKTMGRLAGLPYRRDAALAARDRLAQSGLFRTVSYEGLEGEADWSRAQLVYRVSEPRYNQFEGAVGLQGDAGLAGLARLELGNIVGTGRTLGLRWEAPRSGVSYFSARYGEPLLFGAPLKLDVAVEQNVQDTLYIRTRWGGGLRYALSGQEQLEAAYVVERVVQEFGPVERAELQNTVFGIERNTLDQPLTPRRGTRARIGGSQTYKTEYLRPDGERRFRSNSADVRGEWHRPVTRGTGLSLVAEAAGRFSTQPELPDYERYPVGGAKTLRGYDEEAFRVDRYVLTRLEWNRFVGERGQRAFLFWDHASMATRYAPDFASRYTDVEHRDGYGVGLRLEAAGGLIGVDFGLPAGGGFIDGRVHLQLVTTF